MWCGPCVYATHKIQTHTSPIAWKTLGTSLLFQRFQRVNLNLCHANCTKRSAYKDVVFIHVSHPSTFSCHKLPPVSRCFSANITALARVNTTCPGSMDARMSNWVNGQASSAWQTENNEFGNLKNIFTSSTREQTFLGILMFLGLIYIYNCVYIYKPVRKHHMKSQKLVMHKAVWVSKPLTRQVHLVPPQSSNISKKSRMHVFLEESVWKTIRTRVSRLSSRTVNSKVQNRPRWPRQSWKFISIWGHVDGSILIYSIFWGDGPRWISAILLQKPGFRSDKSGQKPHRAPQTSLGWKETWKMARGYTTRIPH